MGSSGPSAGTPRAGTRGATLSATALLSSAPAGGTRPRVGPSSGGPWKASCIDAAGTAAHESGTTASPRAVEEAASYDEKPTSAPYCAPSK